MCVFAVRSCVRRVSIRETGLSGRKAHLKGCHFLFDHGRTSSWPAPTHTAPDIATDIARIFALQQAHQWDVKASTAEQRKAKLAKLKAAVEAHTDDIIAAVQADTRKPATEIRVTEVLNVTANIQRNIDNLDSVDGADAGHALAEPE
jgi:acyl-CoA reductase-like NAD-dependent aldehyde dehydrogenase